MAYLKRLSDTFQRVKRPGTFATGGPVSTLPLPGLCVNGMKGTLGLPLSEQAAKVLRDKCSQAPFGRREQTIVDLSVRRTWQLDPSQFRIANPKWETSMNDLLSRVQVDLGCNAAQEVTCELYKLLLYEPGGFFKVSTMAGFNAFALAVWSHVPAPSEIVEY